MRHYLGQENDELGQLSTEDVRAWLQNLGVGSRAISEVIEKMKRSKAGNQKSGSEWICESEVLDRLKRFALSKKAIRSFFEQNGNYRAEQGGRELFHWYPKDIVEELEVNYETPDKIMSTLNIEKTAFYSRVGSFKTLKIGRKLLVQKGSIVL